MPAFFPSRMGAPFKVRLGGRVVLV
jgi:hypothetical protein